VGWKGGVGVAGAAGGTRVVVGGEDVEEAELRGEGG